ncbi:MAG: FAD-dependent oxidoreductase [SAR324 cluster bacterium]|nr:FAD-dependent oxidoreductase [SAR324 cluster bacterium]
MQYKIGCQQRPLQIAIIGSGPSGFYAAEGLFRQKEFHVEVDMFERLPTPYGLIRAGVAPDHQLIKSVTKIYEKIALRPEFRFWGNVELGKHVTKAELLERFDAVLYAVGAQVDRGLGIPGADLLGSYSATEFIGWYNGHPDYKDMKFDFSARKVAVIGMGNVAIDIARILAKTPEELAVTDIPQHVLDQIRRSQVEDIYLFARRGPMQVAFTPPEAKELMELEKAIPVVNPTELKLEYFSEKILEKSQERRVIQLLEFLNTISKNDPASKPRRIHFCFRRSPQEIYGNKGTVCGLKVARNELFEDEEGSLKSRETDVFEELGIQLVFRCIGYKVEPLPDVAFDSARGTIANIGGRVVEVGSQKPCPGEYVTGWAKRGPTGVIGTNKPDALETVGFLLKDFRNRETEVNKRPQEEVIADLLKTHQVPFVPFEEWKILDQLELEEGERKDKPREKVTTVEEMLKIIQEKKSEDANHGK